MKNPFPLVQVFFPFAFIAQTNPQLSFKGSPSSLGPVETSVILKRTLWKVKGFRNNTHPVATNSRVN